MSKEIKYSIAARDREKILVVKCKYKKTMLDEINEEWNKIVGSNKNDYIHFYLWQFMKYSRGAEYVYLETDDIGEYCKYLYLSIKSIERAFALYEGGFITDEYTKNILKNHAQGEYAALCAIILGDYELALSVVNKDSVLENILCERYEKALEFSGIHLEDDLHPIYKAVLLKDEVMLKEKIEKRIRELRKYSSNNFTVVDAYSVAAIKLAKKRGLDISINVAEIPKELIDKDYINYEKVKLISNKVMDDFLGLS